MKKIKVNAKSAPIMEQILAKVNAGFKNIEIQLIHEFVSKDEYNNTKEAIKKYGIDISVVHSPLIFIPEKNVSLEINLDDIVIDKYYEMFCDTCKYAQYVSEIEGHRIKVVIHNNYSKENWIKTNLIQEKLGKRIKRILDEFKNVDLVIENGISCGINSFNSIFDMEDVSFAVNELNKIIGNRSKTLLDTCHMMINWEAWKRITYSDLTDWNDTFLKATIYGDLGLIHLNNKKDNGIPDQYHGIAFNKNIESDIEILKQIMNAYEKYSDCEVTIEVREDDYNNIPFNLIKTKEALEYLGYELNLG